MPNRVNLNDEDPDLYEDENDYKPRKENRESAQKKVDRAVKEAGLTPDQRRKLHDALGEDYIDYNEILRRAKEIKKQDEDE